MTVTAIGAAKGSPGVTTTVLALAARWPDHREPLVIEADPSGGDLVARLASLVADHDGMRESPSTVQVAAASRSGVSARVLLGHLQRLPGPGEVRALVGPAGPFAAATAIEALIASGLSGCLAGLAAVDSLVDVGRVDPGSPSIALIRGASRFVLVARPIIESVVHTRELAASLRAAGCRASLLVVGDRPYSPADVAAAVGADELLGVLPDDPVGAVALAGDARSPKILARTRLVRAAGEIADALVERPMLSETHVPPSPPSEPRLAPLNLAREARR